MSRLSRKNREDIIFKDKGGLLDLFDNTIKQYHRINDEEFDYLCENLTDEESNIFINENKNFSQKKQVLSILDKYLIEYYKKLNDNKENNIMV